MNTSYCRNGTPSARHFHPRAHRGYVFILAMVILLVLILLGVTSLKMASNISQWSGRDERKVRAELLAESLAWIMKAYMDQPNSVKPTATTQIINYPGTNQSITFKYSDGSVAGTANGSINWIGAPQDESGNIVPEYAWLVRYRLMAFGTTKDINPATDKPERRLVVTQVRPRSFAKYAYFENLFLAGSYIGEGMRYNGLYHTNGNPVIDYSYNINHRNDNPPPPAIFGDVAEIVGTVTWKPRSPGTSDTDWGYVADGGKAAVKVGAQRIELPTNNNNQKSAAWNGILPESPYPSTDGVYVPNTGTSGAVKGGIFIRGDVSHMVFARKTLDGHEQQQIDVMQGTNKLTRILIDPTTNTTTVKTATTTYPINEGSVTWGPTSTYTGSTNRLIYCTGNINGVHGTLADNDTEDVNGDGKRDTVLNRNAWTLSSDVSAGKNITFDGSLEYNYWKELRATYAAQGKDFYDELTKSVLSDELNVRAGTLGVYGTNVIVADDPTTGNRYFDGSIMAAGGSSGQWKAANKNFTRGGKKGNVYCAGGVINYQAGIFATPTTGYVEHYTYDRRLGIFPPPFFPTTLTYEIDAWQVLNVAE